MYLGLPKGIPKLAISFLETYNIVSSWPNKQNRCYTSRTTFSIDHYICPYDICPETFAQRHLPRITFAQMTIAQKDICPKRHLPRRNLPRRTFAQRDNWPERHLTRKTFAQKTFAQRTICPERQLPRWHLIRKAFDHKYNCPYANWPEIQFTIQKIPSKRPSTRAILRTNHYTISCVISCQRWIAIEFGINFYLNVFIICNGCMLEN
jgi:hypothetical protein